MPLQIRRGTAAERTALTSPLVVGELLYVTDQGKIYIGDGTVIGAADIAGNPGQGGKGLIITGFSSEEAQDATAELFSNGIHSNITFTYNDASNSLSAQIDLTNYTGNIALSGVLSVSGALSVAGGVEAAGFIGSIFSSDSSLVVDAIDRKFFGDLEGDVVGNVVGNVVGDLKGSVFADDSSTMVDAISGQFFGDLNGSVIANNGSTIIDASTRILYGNLVTSIIESPNPLVSPITINSRTITNNVAVISNETHVPAGILQVEGFFGADPVSMTLRKARGTRASPAVVQNLDILGSLQFNAFDGTSYLGAASIQARVAGTVSTGVIPTAYSFFTSSSTGVAKEALSITPDGTVTAFTEAKAISPLVLKSAINDLVGSNLLTLDRSRGTLASPTTLLNDDTIWGVTYRGYDGVKFTPAATVSGAVDGPIVDNTILSSIPGRVEFRTADTTGDFDIRMVLSNDGILKVRALGGIEIADTYDQNYINFTVMPVLPSFADETAANNSMGIGDPTGLQNGMMYYDIALTKIRARAGGIWVDLH